MCLKCGGATVYYIIQTAIVVILPFAFNPLQHKNPGSVYTQEQKGLKIDVFFSNGLFFLAGILVLLTLPLALLGITQHWLHCEKPHLQRPIQRILWIVPIWTTTSWLGLWLPDYAITFDTCRECYEAYAIFQFLVLMSNCLSDELCLDVELARQPAVPHFLFLKHLIAPWYKGRSMARYCKYGILQYVVVRIVTVIIALNCELKNIYRYANHVLLLLNMSSKGIVVYSLIFFYFAHVAELQPLKPLPKLICIKFLVFCSFLINVAVLILLQTGCITKIINVRTVDLKAASNLHDILICAEMFLAVVAFHCIFNYNSYINNPNASQFQGRRSSRDSTGSCPFHESVILNPYSKELSTSRTQILAMSDME